MPIRYGPALFNWSAIVGHLRLRGCCFMQRLNRLRVVWKRAKGHKYANKNLLGYLRISHAGSVVSALYMMMSTDRTGQSSLHQFVFLWHDVKTGTRPLKRADMRPQRWTINAFIYSCNNFIEHIKRRDSFFLLWVFFVFLLKHKKQITLGAVASVGHIKGWILLR